MTSRRIFQRSVEFPVWQKLTKVGLPDKLIDFYVCVIRGFSMLDSAPRLHDVSKPDFHQSRKLASPGWDTCPGPVRHCTQISDVCTAKIPEPHMFDLYVKWVATSRTLLYGHTINSRNIRSPQKSTEINRNGSTLSKSSDNEVTLTRVRWKIQTPHDSGCTPIIVRNIRHITLDPDSRLT